MISNRTAQGPRKSEQFCGKFPVKNRIKIKCYFTATSVFIERRGKPYFAGYSKGCLRPYFHTGFFPNYVDLENVKKKKILAKEKRY